MSDDLHNVDEPSTLGELRPELFPEGNERLSEEIDLVVYGERTHPIYRVRSFKIVSDYTLRVEFDDHTEQTIDFQPILAGELYGPLRDLQLFNQVRIDPEVYTLVWPNGADFDPATLHAWPKNELAFRELAQRR